jgi:hypothetical protein
LPMSLLRQSFFDRFGISTSHAACRSHTLWLSYHSIYTCWDCASVCVEEVHAERWRTERPKPPMPHQ